MLVVHRPGKETQMDEQRFTVSPAGGEFAVTDTATWTSVEFWGSREAAEQACEFWNTVEAMVPMSVERDA